MNPSETSSAMPWPDDADGPSSQTDAPAATLPPVVTVVGYSDSGKTAVASSLIRILTGQGYRIAAVKHCPHGHETDRPGSDTDRHRRAGAVTVVASSPGMITTTERVAGDWTLEAIVASIGADVDLVMAEGFKTSAVPKIIVSSGSATPPSLDNAIAVVDDDAGEWDLPTYGLDTIHLLADQLRDQFLATPRTGSVSLFVEGEHVPLSEYPSRVLADVLKDFVSTLERAPSRPSSIRVRIDSPSDTSR